MNWFSKPQVFAEGTAPDSPDETIINGAPYNVSSAARDSLAEGTPNTSAVPEDSTAKEIKRRQGSLASAPAIFPLGIAHPNL
jgi:hypothetical protein